jgi:hypothetical protein
LANDELEEKKGFERQRKKGREGLPQVQRKGRERERERERGSGREGGRERKIMCERERTWRKGHGECRELAKDEERLEGLGRG